MVRLREEQEALDNFLQLADNPIHFSPLAKPVIALQNGLQVQSLCRLCAGGESRR
jgi:hypothetical protein